MAGTLAHTLRAHGIQPSAQRLAVARVVLRTDEHPFAEEVCARARRILATLSRATVYNTLNLFVERGLLRALVIAEGRTVFDPLTEPHHHFLDEHTGRIFDLPWDSLEVRKVDRLAGFDVRDYQVVLRGRHRGARNPARSAPGRGARRVPKTSRS